MDNTLKLLAILIPIAVGVFTLVERALKIWKKNSKINKAINLKELITTKNDLEIIKQQIDAQNQSILYQKITSLLSDIEEEINASESADFKFESTFKAGFAFSVGVGSIWLNDWWNINFLLDPSSKYEIIVVYLFVLFIFFVSDYLTPLFAKVINIKQRSIEVLVIFPVLYFLLYKIVNLFLHLINVLPLSLGL